MKNVIYTINASSWWWSGCPKDTWEVAPLESMKKFADRVKADLVVVNEDSIPTLCLPATFTPYQCSNMLKFYVFDHFVNSDYEKMLFLDLDIVVNENARNIFEEFECKGIHMMTQNWTPQIKAFQFFLLNHFNLNKKIINPEAGEAENENETIPLYSGCSIIANKHSICDFYQKVPKLGEWFDFFRKYDLHKNPKSPDDVEFNEQNLISLFFHQQGVRVHRFFENWLRHFQPYKPLEHKDADAVHYSGPKGKKYLEEIMQRAEV